MKVGLSIDSNLVEISPIANEVPMNEVGALLNSYRRNRRYHRLKDGTFVDLKRTPICARSIRSQRILTLMRSSFIPEE